MPTYVNYCNGCTAIDSLRRSSPIQIRCMYCRHIYQPGNKNSLKKRQVLRKLGKRYIAVNYQYRKGTTAWIMVEELRNRIDKVINNEVSAPPEYER